MKKIVHIQFDLESQPFNEAHTYYKNIKEFLGDDYTVFASPFHVTFNCEDDVALSIDCKDYTHKELEEIFNKAAMYDDLCR